MTELDNLFLYCVEKFDKDSCEKCAYTKCLGAQCPNCYDCLRTIHNVDNCSLHYQCRNIRFNYILKFFNRYASEIVYIVHPLLKKYFLTSNNIIVYSLGCGPSSELYSIMFSSRLSGLEDSHIHYYGFDISSQWDEISKLNKSYFPKANISFLHEDMFGYIKNGTQHIDIMILNYVLSDIMRYDKSKGQDIADKMIQVIRSKRISYVIVNDIPLFYTSNNDSSAYVLMNKIEKAVQNEDGINVIKYHFSIPNEYQPKYGGKIKNDLLFNTPKEVEPFEPMPQCGSIGQLISVK
ncbi:MAG: class I SAM-dependent methyltransferase [Prevotella sp.]|nr:hypothetical protein [Prevotella sp.]MCH4183316.1 class I SAM-dependent methyltransferase [Prevotella sp.]MCH4242104.1 class I SAM-dependent methyltransferase [Prevotella sp.]